MNVSNTEKEVTMAQIGGDRLYDYVIVGARS